MDNPTLKFALAWAHLKRKYMDLQENTRHEEPLLNSLINRFIQLKMDILDDSKPFQNDRFQIVRTQTREAELTKGNMLRFLSRVKWLGTGDEPDKTFFAILKAK